MKKGEVKKEEEKPVSVVEKWSMDIEGMRETAKSMKETAKNLREQSIKRANMRMKAFRNNFNNDIKRFTSDIKQIEITIGNLHKGAKAFIGQCHRDMGSMKATVVKMQEKLNIHNAKVNDYRAKFENDINGMMGIVKGMAIHIWGTTA